MRKITFPLFRRFILWLKKVLCLKSNYEEASLAGASSRGELVEIAQPSETSLSKISPVEEKHTEPCLLDGEIAPLQEKTISKILSSETPIVTTLPQAKPPEVSSKVSGEPQLRCPQEGTETEKEITQKDAKDTSEPQKPYKKKVFTEKRKREPVKIPTNETTLYSPEQMEPIYLGSIQSRRRKIVSTQQKLQRDEDIDKEINNRISEERKFADVVESPFVEIDLDNAKVYLTLPRQRFKTNTEGKAPQQLTYTVDLNGKRQKVLTETVIDENVVRENRISLEEHLLEFSIIFPMEFKTRVYSYVHNNGEIYVFIPRGNNRGRMHYLYDKNGNVNPIPKKVVWILLHEDVELRTEPDVIEETWVWDEYKPFRVDTGEIGFLVIKNKISGEEKRFSLQPTFRLEGEQLIKDDFKEGFPMFMGKVLKVIAPYENRSGWNVWIQNQIAGFKVKENWTGSEPLMLNCPGDLPCDCGEFQVDICQQNTRIPDETLFFRWMPYIKLVCSQELIIPDPKVGHSPQTISINLDSNNEWELKRKDGQKFEPRQNGVYQIELPPEDDTLRFSIAKANTSESVTNFQVTVPRVKWKTFSQNIWDGKFQKLERDDLEHGKPLCLLIKTNDFDNKYDLLAILEANDHKLQEGKFIRKGVEYSLEFNQFFDTVMHHKEDELILRVEIRKAKEPRLLASVETFYFESKPKVPKKTLPPKSKQENISEIPQIYAMVKCPGKVTKWRKGKGFSRKELISASIDLKNLWRLGIPYDKRRKSSHLLNINTLEGKYGNYSRR